MTLQDTLENELKQLTGRSSDEIQMLNKDLEKKTYKEVCGECSKRFEEYSDLSKKHHPNTRIVRIAKVKHNLVVAEFMRRNMNDLK